MTNNRTPQARAGAGTAGLGIVLALIAATAFAGNSTSAAATYDAGVTPLTALLARTFAAFVLVGLALLVRPAATRLTSAERWWAVAIGVLVAIYSFGILAAIAFIPVALAVLVFYSYPLMTFLTLVASGRARISPLVGGAFVVALAGLALALEIDDFRLDPRGVGLALLAAVGVTAVFVLNNRVVGAGDSRPVTLLMMASASVVVVAAAAISGDVALPASATGWWTLAGVAGFYAIAVVTIFIAISKAGPVRTTLAMHIEPVASVVFGWSLLGQALSGLQVVGVALVIAALLAVRFAGGVPS